MNVETTTLIPAVARGDLVAFEELYDRYSSTLYALLLRILSNPEDAQEVLQEAFVKVWTNAGSYDASRGSEAAFLISIARSRGIDRLRSRRIRSDRENDAGREISVHSSFVVNRTGSDDAIQSQERKAVRSALTDLPEAQRLALELAYFDGLSQSEIAAKLGEPLGTIKTRMQLGMKKLRERLRAFQ
jgi:RNA polymerase sigma-70 factor (ECF subfamily)